LVTAHHVWPLSSLPRSLSPLGKLICSL